MAVELCLLGDVEARIDGSVVDLGHARQRCVLALLAVDANRVVPVDQLLDRVWGDRLPQRARGTLRSYLSRLRRALAATSEVEIARRPGGYVLTVDPMAVDLHRFPRLVAEARAADDETAAVLFEQALGLWRGEAFAMLDTPWLNDVRAAVNQERLAAELDRNDLALGHGQHAELVGELRNRAGEHALNERLAGQLMVALYRCGRQAEALDTYQRVRVRLIEELGTHPSPPLEELHRQILAADPALAASGTTARSSVVRPPAPRQLPMPPSTFTGRDRELAALDKALDESGRGATMVISAIGGCGGMGKTWLAMRWAHDNIERFPDGQLYVNLRGFDPGSEPVPPAVAVRGFLDALGVQPAAIPADPDAQAGLYRSLVAGKRMLILLDNARDSTQVTSLLPGTESCTVLVTSRHQLTGLVTAHGARPLALDVLTNAEAHQLLTRHVGADRAAAEAQAVRVLLDRCAGLPLALGIIAARAAISPDFPLAALAEDLTAAPTRLDALDAGEPQVNLRAVLTCSFHALAPDAAHVFALLGLAPGPDISLPGAASLTGLHSARARNQLRDLTIANLVHEHAAGRYRMHDLVRLFAAEQGNTLDTESRREAVHRLLDHYLHTADAAAILLLPQADPMTLAPPRPGVTPESLAGYSDALAWFTTEHQVLLTAITHAAGAEFDAHTWQLARTLETFLNRRGHWHDWAATGRMALDAARRSADRSAQAYAHRGLALANVRLARFGDAPGHLRQALDLFATIDDRTGQAHTYRSLSRVAAQQGLFRDALPHAQQALDLYRATGHLAGQAHALNAVGWFHAHLDDPQHALTCCQQALTLHQELDDRHGQATVWDSLGYAHHRLGDYQQAIACYQQSLALWGVVADRYSEAECLSHLGDSHHAAGSHDLARDAWRRALDSLDELGHPDAGQVRGKLDCVTPNPSTPRRH